MVTNAIRTKLADLEMALVVSFSFSLSVAISTDAAVVGGLAGKLVDKLYQEGPK